MVASATITVRPCPHATFGTGWTSIRAVPLSRNDQRAQNGMVFFNQANSLIAYSTDTGNPDNPQKFIKPPLALGNHGWTTMVPLNLDPSDKIPTLPGLLFYAADSGLASYFRANGIEALPEAKPIHEFVKDDNFGGGWTTIEVYRFNNRGVIPSDGLVLYNIHGIARYLLGQGLAAQHVNIDAADVKDASPGFTTVLPLHSHPNETGSSLLSYDAATGTTFYSRNKLQSQSGDFPQEGFFADTGFGAGWTIIRNVFVRVDGNREVGLFLYNIANGDAKFVFGWDGTSYAQSALTSLAPGWTEIVSTSLDGLDIMLLYNATTGAVATASSSVSTATG